MVKNNSCDLMQMRVIDVREQVNLIGLRWLVTVSSTFQYSEFDWSL